MLTDDDKKWIKENCGGGGDGCLVWATFFLLLIFIQDITGCMT